MKRNEGFLLQNVGGENLLVPLGSQVLDTNAIITLNDTARCVWELLAQQQSLDDLAAAIAEEFDVDPARAREDVQNFLEEIEKVGLLTR